MKLRYGHIITAGLLLLTNFALLNAQQTGSLDVPRTISYQGLLTTGNGQQLSDGLHTITVTLYGDQFGREVIWQDHFQTETTNGLFNIYLGAGKQALPTEMNRPLWVSTSVDGGAEMLPLTPLTSSPYALGISNKAITTEKLADGAVTAEKMGTEYLSGIQIDKQLVSEKGSILRLQSSEDFQFAYDEGTKSITIRQNNQRGTSGGDQEKGAQTLDDMDATRNWIGRDKILWPLTSNPYVHTTSPGSYNTLGGGELNHTGANVDWATIAGGQDNEIKENGDWSTIAGGEHNIIGEYADWSTIAGGQDNLVDDYADRSTIAGGNDNSIGNYADASTIGGGENNVIDHYVDWATIAGGNTNKILNTGSTLGTISGGEYNTIGSVSDPVDWGTIGGGDSNLITGNHGTVSGGRGNKAYNTATVGGGLDNYATGIGATIAGGAGQNATANYSTVSGGHGHTAAAGNSTVGGGWSNSVASSGDYSTVAGGTVNNVEGQYGTVAGGYYNRVLDAASGYGTIAGGSGNWIGDPGVGANFGSIGGGENNHVTFNHGTISGGKGNQAYNTATVGGGADNLATGIGATIGGGAGHKARSNYSTISGGNQNTISTQGGVSTIGGGYNNRITNTGGAPIADYFTIAGGEGNLIESAPTSYGISTIGGGAANRITAAGHEATIPGGEWLIAQSWAQTVIGAWNQPKGAVPFRYQGATDKNEPIFIIGNGTQEEDRHNAFEVSYNGHSIVYDENGSGGWTAGPGRGAVDGGTYTDNVIYGWAEVDMNADPGQSCGDFGIQSIAHPMPGLYVVTLNIVAPDGSTPATINCGAVTATLGSGMGLHGSIPPTLNCANISTSNIVGNVFEVYITRQQMDPNAPCTEGIDQAFKFHVTGRVD